MSTPTLVFAILSLVLPLGGYIYLECTSEDETTRLEKKRNQFYSNYYSLWR